MFYKYLVNVMWLFFMVQWVCLLFVIVVFPDHTQLISNAKSFKKCCPSKRSAHHIHFDKTMHEICLAILK